jgi:hypothetical protein
MSWVHPKTIIGPPAKGDKYLPRPGIEGQFWQSLQNGEHMVFVAPRRVGKSSIMVALVAAQQVDHCMVYQNIESCGTTAEFYQRLWELLIAQENRPARLVEQVKKLFLARKIKGITLEGGFELEDARIDHKAVLMDLLRKLGKERVHVVLLLDEFPEVIARVHKNEGAAAAVDILHTLREMRHSDEFKHFTLVLAGSIGLHHVVAKLDRPKLVNDLRTIDVPALDVAEGHLLLDLILQGASLKVPPAVRTIILDTIGVLLPYHIQLLIADMDILARAAGITEATPDLVEQAVQAVIARHDKFHDWESRLHTYLDEADYAYSFALLTCCAHREDLTVQEAFALSKTVEPATSYKNLIDDVLVRDGYLLQTDNHLAFRSPFLKRWWANRHPAHEIPSGL